MPPEELHYLCVPDRTHVVARPVEFRPIDQVLGDESLCTAIWDLVTEHFHTRSKFLAIWPSVRFVAICRNGREIGGFLLVSTPLNWQIDYVVVRENMRHQGVAAALVQETLNQAYVRRVPYVMLTSKESLRPLYEGQCGFTVVASSIASPRDLLTA
jgi:GNAT superfamily N-acetyltransferase